jgi:hypothetical protein
MAMLLIKILPTEVAIFPQKLDFEFTAFGMKVEEAKLKTINSHCIF